MTTGHDSTVTPVSDPFLPSLRSLPIAVRVLFLLGVCGFAALALFSDQYLIAGAAIGVMAVALLMARNPRLWLYGAILLWVVWFRSSDKDVSALDVGLIAYYIGGLVLWFGSSIVQRRRLMYNVGDKLILIAVSLCLVNICIAYLNNVSPMSWAREFLLFCFLLYYFPFREHIHTKKQLQELLWLLVVVICIIGGMNIQMYLKATSNALYAYNIYGSRVTLSEIVFLGSSLTGIVFLLYARTLLAKLTFLVLVVFWSAVLVASFTRGAWFAYIIGCSLIFLFVSWRRKIALLSALTLGVGVFFFIVAIFFSNLQDVLFYNIGNRFFSSTKGVGDPSLKSRYLESEKVIEGIVAHPLSGNGFGARITFYDIIPQMTTRPHFLHNGYLFLTFKVGIPLALMFIGALLWYAYRGLVLRMYPMRDPVYYCVTIGATSTLISVLIISITSNQFAIRDGIFMLAMYLAFISIVDRYGRLPVVEVSLPRRLPDDSMPPAQETPQPH